MPRPAFLLCLLGIVPVGAHSPAILPVGRFTDTQAAILGGITALLVCTLLGFIAFLLTHPRN